MSKKNMELLDSMSVEDGLTYAEKLVFGADEIEQDLSAGMNVIKREANTGNPQAMFLMYKVNISKGKINTAIEWLRKSCKDKYGLALAMSFYEYIRNNTRALKENEALENLEEAVKMDIPVAHHFLGVIYREGWYSYDKNEIKAKMHFKKAEELGYTDAFLDVYEYETFKYDMNTFRGIFQRNDFLDLTFNYTDALINSIMDGNDKELISAIWRDMIIKHKIDPQYFTLELNTELLGHDEKDNIYYLIVMPEISSVKGENLAIYYMVVFNKNPNIQPRLFLGELDSFSIFGRLVFVVEIRNDRDDITRINCGPITFDEFKYNMKPENEKYLFIDMVMNECLDDNL